MARARLSLPLPIQMTTAIPLPIQTARVTLPLPIQTPRRATRLLISNQPATTGKLLTNHRKFGHGTTAHGTFPSGAPSSL